MATKGEILKSVRELLSKGYREGAINYLINNKDAKYTKEQALAIVDAGDASVGIAFKGMVQINKPTDWKKAKAIVETGDVIIILRAEGGTG